VKSAACQGVKEVDDVDWLLCHWHLLWKETK